MSLPCSSWASHASASSALTCSPVVRYSCHALSVSCRNASRFSSRSTYWVIASCMSQGAVRWRATANRFTRALVSSSILIDTGRMAAAVIGIGIGNLRSSISGYYLKHTCGATWPLMASNGPLTHASCVDASLASRCASRSSSVSCQEQGVDFLGFLSQLMREEPKKPVTDEVRSMLRRSWAEITAPHKDTAEVSLTAADLGRLLQRLLDGLEPRVAQCQVLCKDVHSPDFMLATRSLEAVEPVVADSPETLAGQEEGADALFPDAPPPSRALSDAPPTALLRRVPDLLRR